MSLPRIPSFLTMDFPNIDGEPMSDAAYASVFEELMSCVGTAQAADVIVPDPVQCSLPDLGARALNIAADYDATGMTALSVQLDTDTLFPEYALSRLYNGCIDNHHGELPSPKRRQVLAGKLEHPYAGSEPPLVRVADTLSRDCARPLRRGRDVEYDLDAR